MTIALKNYFAATTKPETKKIRPLGTFSDYVVNIMPQRLNAITEKDPSSPQPFADEASTLSENLPPQTDVVSLLDQKMLYRGLVQACITYPDHAGLHRAREGAARKLKSVIKPGAILGLTYDDIILNNPAEDIRLFTTGETGHYEACFYRGHQIVEEHLSQAIKGLNFILDHPHESSRELLIKSQSDITAFRHAMMSFRKDLPTEEFMRFKPYFDTDPYRGEKGPSGAFSAKVQHLIVLLFGKNMPADRLAYIQDNTPYFPPDDLAALHLSQRRGMSLKEIAASGLVDSSIVDAINMTMLGFLQAHRGTVTKHMGIAANGSAEQGHAGQFLDKRIEGYKEAMRAPKNGDLFIMTETFTLYDLKITMIHTQDGRRSLSQQENGTYFLMQGENLIFPCGDHSFPLYSLASLLPLLPAKQRETDAMDWMSSDCIIADPDPHSGLQYKIERTGKRIFNRANVTAVPLGEQ